MKTLALFLSALLFVAAPLRAADAPDMLRVLAYDRSIPREVCLSFTEKTGIPVEVVSTISSMEAADFLYRKKEAFDLLILSNDVVRAMRDRDRLVPLNLKKIRNISEIKSAWSKAAGDAQGKFRIPFDVAAMGILVNKSVQQPPVTGYMDAFRKPRPGGVAVMVDQRDLLAAALLSLGASVNELSTDNLRASRSILKDWLRNIAPGSSAVWSNDHADAFNALRKDLVEGRLGAALLYSGDAYSLMTEYPGRFEWITPTEGSLKYMTVLAIPASSNKADAAHKFIDFILDPRIAGELVTSASPGLGLNLPKEKIPLNFYGNPANIEASQLMDDFSVQADITREPRQEVLDLFKSLPAPTAPPAP